MGYIKFVLGRRSSDGQGNTTRAVISRIESDMAGVGINELNLILHALSAKGGKVETIVDFVLDAGILDNLNDVLG